MLKIIRERFILRFLKEIFIVEPIQVQLVLEMGPDPSLLLIRSK